MFDEIIKKLTKIFHSNQKTFLYPQKNKFKPKKKILPSLGYFVNTMD